MHIESAADQTVMVEGNGATFPFRQGERIHTENSKKYTEASIAALAGRASLLVQERWNDSRGWFGQFLLRPA
jgi:uncharacterized SAM-dependent methyltransferase